MSKTPKNANLPEWITAFVEQAVALEQIWQMKNSDKPVTVDAEVTILVNEEIITATVDVTPLTVIALHKVAGSPFDVGAKSYEFIEKLLADVDNAIKLLGGDLESKKWNRRDVIGILAEAKAYQTIEANLSRLTRQTKRRILRNLEADLVGKKTSGLPGLTEEEKARFLANYDESGLSQRKFIKRKNGVSRATLNRMLRERRANGDEKK